MNIRPATRDDMPVLLEMVQALSAYHGDTATVSPDWLADIFFGDTPQAAAYLAEMNGKSVGYMGIVKRIYLHYEQPRFDIHHLFIMDGYRKMGIGKALIARAQLLARDGHAKSLTIGTDTSNKTAQAAYRGMGLEEITDLGPQFRIAFG